MTKTQISAHEPDWSREHKSVFSWCPSRSLLASIRAYQGHSGSRNPLSVLMAKIAIFRHRFWSAVSGADIPINVKIGGGLLLPHPNGIVIHPDAQIGPNCLLFQQVTIGALDGRTPCLGGHVDVGAGAKLRGGILIGDHALIGANAVVLINVPAGKTAAGIPAAILESKRT